MVGGQLVADAAQLGGGRRELGDGGRVLDRRRGAAGTTGAERAPAPRRYPPPAPGATKDVEPMTCASHAYGLGR